MRTRALFAALALLLALGGVACDGDSRAEPDGTKTETPTATDAASIGPIGTTQDKYRYQNAGLNVLIDFDADGAGGSMEVTNKSGHDLPRPGFYILDARDGHEIDGKVIDAQPVPDGGTEEFEIRVTPRVQLKDVGLVILLMGADNYGAFVNV